MYSARSEDLNNQTAALDSSLLRKEIERTLLVQDISRNPMIKVTNAQTRSVPVQTTTKDSINTSITRTNIVSTTESSTTSIENPKKYLLGPIDQQLSEIRNQKIEKETPSPSNTNAFVRGTAYYGGGHHDK